MKSKNIDYSANHYIRIDGVSLYADKVNKRLKFFAEMKLEMDTIKKIIEFSKSNKLGKIIVYCKQECMNAFEKNGFVSEGIIKGFFNGEDSICLSYFVDFDRSVSKRRIAEDAVLAEAIADKNKSFPSSTIDYCVRTADVEDVPKMIKLFNDVFETYPSPVNDIQYLADAMKERVMFQIAEKDGEVIGIASADMDFNNMNAEITDCATDPKYRGNGILPSLIMNLENRLAKRNFVVLYSLSRATNKGINKTLSKLGYDYNGRMVNNCNICGRYEDMNIWTKFL